MIWNAPRRQNSVCAAFLRKHFPFFQYLRKLLLKHVQLLRLLLLLLLLHGGDEVHRWGVARGGLEGRLIVRGKVGIGCHWPWLRNAAAVVVVAIVELLEVVVVVGDGGEVVEFLSGVFVWNPLLPLLVPLLHADIVAFGHRVQSVLNNLQLSNGECKLELVSTTMILLMN